MRKEWIALSGLLCGCATGQVAQSNVVNRPAPSVGIAALAMKSEAGDGVQSAAANASAKTFEGDAAGCTPASGEPKVVSGESSASDSADTGLALIFEVAGVALEIPACTPGADVRVITASWETKSRPTPSRIHPSFVRHGATLRVDQTIVARDSAPLLVRLQSKRELVKPGEKLVLAVESSGECDAQHRRDKLADGGCAHWRLYDARYDTGSVGMVATIPGTTGHRLQFGWIPAK